MALVRFNQPNSLFPYRSLLNDMMNDFSVSVGHDARNGVPAVNIRETEAAYLLDVAAPGLSREQFGVHVNGRVLTLSAEAPEEKTETNVRWARREFGYGAFKRSFTLPQNVNADQIEARYENGILQVAVPKAEEVKPKQIEIK